MGVIGNILASKKVNYATKGIIGAVVGTTVLKAVGRPMFIYADKKTDKESRKYTATKELLYQILCLGLTFAMVIPAQILMFKHSKKFIKDIAELGNIKKYGDFKKVNKDLDELTSEAQSLLGTKEKPLVKLSDDSKKQLKLVKGADELSSFVTSIIGLTIVAPAISHEILHPIMHAIGMDHKVPEKSHALQDLEQPILSEGYHKVDTKA